jgi:hypothetical protein
MLLKTGSTGHRYRCRGADPLTEAVSGRQARSRRPAFDVLLRLVHRIPGTPCQVLDCLGEEFAPAILFAPAQLAA